MCANTLNTCPQTIHSLLKLKNTKQKQQKSPHFRIFTMKKKKKKWNAAKNATQFFTTMHGEYAIKYYSARTT